MAETRFDMMRDMEKWRERMYGKPMNHGRVHTDAFSYTGEGKEGEQ